MSKIILANWHKKEEGLGGQEVYFYELAQILNARRISYYSSENVVRKMLFQDITKPVIYQAYVIDDYLKKYENLFPLDLIIKNAGIFSFTDLKTPQIAVFQDPFYSIQKFMLEKGVFLEKFEWYNASIELQRRAAEQSFLKVAVSNFMKEDMKMNGIECDKVIEEGVDIEKFKPIENKEILKKVHNLPLDKKICVCVTKFIYQKGWEILAELINRFKDIHWIIVLSNATGKRPKLKNVTLIERANPELMPRIYNCADFFLSTSPVESFGLSACEAASCNLPIIVFKTGFAWDWWDNELGIRVDEWNYKAFEIAINNLNGDFEPRKALIEKGFTLERMAKDWKEFIENLLKK